MSHHKHKVDVQQATHEEIAALAYQIWLESGNDDAAANWCAAEARLVAKGSLARVVDLS